MSTAARPYSILGAYPEDNQGMEGGMFGDKKQPLAALPPVLCTTLRTVRGARCTNCALREDYTIGLLMTVHSAAQIVFRFYWFATAVRAFSTYPHTIL